jgi:WD40 repeat protein
MAGGDDFWARQQPAEERPSLGRVILGATAKGRLARLGVLVVAVVAAVIAGVLLRPSGPPSAASGLILTAPDSPDILSHSFSLSGGVFSADGTLVAGWGLPLTTGTTLHVWKAGSGSYLKTIDLPFAATAVAISTDDKWVIVADEYGGVSRWSIGSGLASQLTPDVVPAGSTVVPEFALSDGGTTLAVVDGTGADVIDTATDARVATLRNPDKVKLFGSSPGLEQLSLDADGGRLAIGDPSGRLYIWDVRRSQVIQTLRYDDSSVLTSSGGWAGVLSPNGKTVLIPDPGTALNDIVLNVSTAAIVTPRGPWGIPEGVLVSSNGRVIATQDPTTTSVSVWNFTSRSLHGTYNYFDGDPRDNAAIAVLAISPDGTRLLFTGGTAYIFTVP